MIIDVHAHIMTEDYERDKRDIREAISRYGIDRLYISAIDGAQFYPNVEQINSYNAEMHRFMREDETHIKGYCYVNPNNSNTLDVLKNGYENYGMSGVKLWVSNFCDDTEVFPVIEFCIERDWPVLIHSFHKAIGQLPHETTGPNVAALARRYPNAKLLMAHLGANCYHGIKAIKNCPNVMVDFSGSIFRRDDIDYTVEMLGADRIMFGTDLPQPGSFLSNLGRVMEAELSQEQRDKIMY
ncbi:MAG: amidohydrolase family protein, partial [Christensenella sp.]